MSRKRQSRWHRYRRNLVCRGRGEWRGALIALGFILGELSVIWLVATG